MLIMKNEETKLSMKDKFMIGGLAVIAVGIGVAYISTNRKIDLSFDDIENLKTEHVEINKRLDRVDAVLDLFAKM